MTTTIETKRNDKGQMIRLQKRGNRFDVTRNSTGYCWMYLLKGVSEDAARSEFFLQTVLA